MSCLIYTKKEHFIFIYKIIEKMVGSTGREEFTFSTFMGNYWIFIMK